MIYYTDEARSSARDNLTKIEYKLAKLKPTDSFTYDDISNLFHVLQEFDEALRSEQYNCDKLKRK